MISSFFLSKNLTAFLHTVLAAMGSVKEQFMVKKLWSLVALSAVFAIVLAMIYGLAKERAYFQSSQLLSLEDYRMIMRSLKYGLLLVVLVFSVCFISEILQDWRMHPMQYLFVGAGLSIFYLLLLSLAEHIGFSLAYFLGAAACIGLLVWYLGFVLPKQSGVWAMGLLLSGAYFVMFMLLKLQQYNLLVGSCLLFAALFAVMFCTRHVDWYQIGAEHEAK